MISKFSQKLKLNENFFVLHTLSLLYYEFCVNLKQIVFFCKAVYLLQTTIRIVFKDNIKYLNSGVYKAGWSIVRGRIWWAGDHHLRGFTI